ncbi:STYKc [Musa troglodytarum]|uniref:STYKc n=1 Tax=Musa troglodytarum TaxID=320322 RepID=A0A9E7L9G5_9LILI|nr:STYKc [Musa troglodytarum]
MRTDHPNHLCKIITATPSDSLSTCLANVGSGTPFISSLESRHIDDHLAYQDANQSAALEAIDSSITILIKLTLNFNHTSSKSIQMINMMGHGVLATGCIVGCETWNFTSSTTLGIKTSRGDAYEVPGVVMGTATVAADNFTLQYPSGYGLDSIVETTFYIFLHFADFDYLTGNGSRIFQVRADGEPDGDNISPAYLPATHVHFVHRLAYPEYDYLIYGSDSKATNVYFRYHLMLRNLSYHGLNGAIPNALANLKALNHLDLSNNDLTGPIPPSLEELTSLNVLILSNNRLNGPIPASLCDGQSKGLLELRFVL